MPLFDIRQAQFGAQGFQQALRVDITVIGQSFSQITTRMQVIGLNFFESLFGNFFVPEKNALYRIVFFSMTFYFPEI